MKDFKEIPCELVEEKDKYYLIFWHTKDGAVSQDLGFETEAECDIALEEVKQGKGLKFMLPHKQAKIDEGGLGCCDTFRA